MPAPAAEPAFGIDRGRHPDELRTEDNQSTNPGTVLAFSKLSNDPAIKAIVGPIASTQIQAASPAIAKAGIPTMIRGRDPSLTRVNNKWVFRARPNAWIFQWSERRRQTPRGPAHVASCSRPSPW
jgi:ABC-type branched-subunit amino acid transport system substrate-binding protein